MEWLLWMRGASQHRNRERQQRLSWRWRFPCTCASADVERARLLHQYPLHRASADAQRIAYLQYARAALAATRVGRLRSKSSPGGRAAEQPSGSSQLLNCLDWPNVHRLAPFTPDQHRTRKSRAIGNNATARRPFDTPSPCRCGTLRFKERRQPNAVISSGPVVAQCPQQRACIL